MGNCHAVAEAAAVVIMHPGNNKTERIYNSVSARHVMSLNPGHCVGVIVTMQGPQSENGMPVKKLKLLRPDDMLLIGNIYRLVCFEDVLKEFAAKKCVKLGKLLKERGVLVLEKKKRRPVSPMKRPNASSIKSHKVHHGGSNDNRSRARGRHHHHQHQWKPVLKSISEFEN